MLLSLRDASSPPVSGWLEASSCLALLLANATASAAPATSAPAASAPAASAPATSRAPYARATVQWLVEPVDNTSGYHLATLGDGSVLVAGHNQSNVSSRDDLFAERIAADGARRWYVSGTAKHLRAVSARDDHAFVLSEVIGKVDLLGLRAHTKDTVAVLAKLDGAGALAWGQVHTSGSFTRAPSLAATPDGGVVIALELFAPPKAGPLAIPLAGSSDVVLVKHDAAGALAWVRAFDWPGYDAAAGVVAHDAGLWVAGTRWKTPSTELGARAEPCHGWVARLDEGGAPQWSVELGGGPGRVELGELVPIPGRGVVALGRIEGRHRIGAIELDAGGTQRSLVAELDRSGAVLWAGLGERTHCTVADAQGGLLQASPTGLRSIAARGAVTELLRFDAGAVLSLTGCAFDPSGAVYLGGTLARGSSLAGVAPSAPRTQRWKERWAQTNEVGFVARVELR